MSLTKTTTLSLEIGANMTDAHQPRPITSSNNFQSQASELFSACYQQDPITARSRSARLQRIRRDAVGLGCAAVDQRG